MPAESADQALLRMGEGMAGVRIGLLDPAQMRLQKGRRAQRVDAMVPDMPEADESALKTCSFRMPWIRLLVINDQARKTMWCVCSVRRSYPHKTSTVMTASDLLAASHAIELSSANQSSSDYRFTVTPTGDRISSDYLSEADDFIIEVKDSAP